MPYFDDSTKVLRLTSQSWLEWPADLTFFCRERFINAARNHEAQRIPANLKASNVQTALIPRVGHFVYEVTFASTTIAT